MPVSEIYNAVGLRLASIFTSVLHDMYLFHLFIPIRVLMMTVVYLGGYTGALSNGIARYWALFLYLHLQAVLLLCTLSGQLQRQLRHRGPCARMHEYRCRCDGVCFAECGFRYVHFSFLREVDYLFLKLLYYTGTLPDTLPNGEIEEGGGKETGVESALHFSHSHRKGHRGDITDTKGGEIELYVDDDLDDISAHVSHAHNSRGYAKVSTELSSHGYAGRSISGEGVHVDSGGGNGESAYTKVKGIELGVM